MMSVQGFGRHLITGPGDYPARDEDMIDEDLVEAVLDVAMSQGRPLLAEVRAETSESRDVSVKSGVVSSIVSSRDAGMNVRIVLPTGIGFASSNGLSKSVGAELAKRAYMLARNVRLKQPVEMSAESPVRTSWEVRQDKPLSDVSLEDEVNFLKRIDSAVAKSKVKVEGRYIEAKTLQVHGRFANSDGSRISSFLPRVRVDSSLVVTSKGESEQSMREFGGTGGWEVVEGWDLEKALVDEVHMLKTVIDKGKMVKPGKYDLVCGPEVSGIAAHESCGHPMEADRILGREMSQAGKSFVKPEMINFRIGSEYATVVDDPTIPGSYGYYAYDQEGVRSRPRYLYKEGLIHEFLMNRETAATLGCQSNASSRSENYIKEPIVRMANTHVAPGDFEDDEIFGSIKEGVLMHSFTEWNIDDKRYNQKYVSR
jgi:TldD protein